MKYIFIICLMILTLFFDINISSAQDFNEVKVGYSQSYQINLKIRRIETEINKKYKEIQKIKRSNNLSQNEKQIKIRKLKAEISSKEKEVKRLKLKSKKIIS